MIFFPSGSLSALQAVGKIETDLPLQIQIQDLSHKMDVDQKEIAFMWVPGLVLQRPSRLRYR